MSDVWKVTTFLREVDLRFNKVSSHTQPEYSASSLPSNTSQQTPEEMVVDNVQSTQNINKITVLPSFSS